MIHNLQPPRPPPVLATAVSAWDGQRVQEKSKNAVTSIDGLNNLFRETHVMNIAEGDEFLEALWERRVRTPKQPMEKEIRDGMKLNKDQGKGIM